MLRKTTLLALAGALTATAATAEEHVILIMPEAYFPAVIYVDSGDTLRFVNTTEIEHSIIAEDAEWAVGPIAAGGEATLAVTGGMERSFYRLDTGTGEAVEGEEEDIAMQGELDFGSPGS